MRKSFTLIEILVVIVIIGILSAFIIVSMAGISDKARIAKGQAFSNSLKNSLLLSLVSEWKLDGNANDSWSGKNGTLVGPPTLVANCVQNACYSFDGSDYVWIADDPAFNFGTKMSAFVWVKGVAQSDKYVFAQLDANTNWVWGIAVDSLGRLRSLVASTGAVTPRRDYTAISATPFDNTWHLVGFTFNNGTLKLYIDGLEASVSKNQDDAVTTIYNSAINLTIGSYLGAGYFTGQIDEVRLYNESIPTSQIQESYYSGLNRLLTGNGIGQEEFTERVSQLKYSVGEN